MAVSPLQTCRETGARVLTDLTRPVSQYADIAMDIGSDIAADINESLIVELYSR